VRCGRQFRRQAPDSRPGAVRQWTRRPRARTERGKCVTAGLTG
jgi:hypothetical protein